jgi:hypothetical protein
MNLVWDNRCAMTMYEKRPTRLAEVGGIGEDDFVVAFVPRNHEVLEFIQRVKAGRPARRAVRADRRMRAV